MSLAASRKSAASWSATSSIDVHSTSYQSVDSTVASAQWYDIYMVMNNSVDTWQMYYTENSGAPTLATTTAGSLSTLTMRNGGEEAINAFMVATSQIATATTSYIDDIYIDTTDSNLISPVPEPSAALIGGLGMLTLLRRRRA